MKYCPKCKTRMPADAAACSKCGGTLRTLGERSAEPETAAATLVGPPDLALQLAGLQHQVQRSRKALVLAGAAAIALAIVLVVLVTGIYFYNVFQYAPVAGLEVAPGSAGGEARIAVERTGPGKIEFVRSGGGVVETLIEHGGATAGGGERRQEFTWSGGRDDDYTLTARYRAGWGVARKRWEYRGGRMRAVE